jgi:amino acid transporter
MASEDTTTSSAPQGEQQHGARRLGAFLCWAIVFADIGTSVYYTPGILFAQPGVGTHAALFVAMTLVVFVLLTRKYGEVAVRYPEGGGVVTVATRALHPFVGVVGGMFILVDYFLTAALSSLSGVIYLSDVAPALTAYVLPATIVALIVLGTLNLIGISESAKVNATFAVVAAASQIAVVLAVIVHVGPGQLVAELPRVLSGPRLTSLQVLTGYAGAFLAFSGLESISQLSPVMAEPRRRVTRLAMGTLIATMALTSPLLTLWSTTILPITSSTDPNQFISLLGGFALGRAFEIEVAISGALLLVFASNTAIIGSYHVFLALARMGFLPQVIETRNRWRDTPHWAILTVVAIPVLVLILAQGSVSLLGDLYAFGLLGAFSLTCLALDIVRWQERHPGGKPQSGTDGVPSEAKDGEATPVGPITFALGILTTILVVLAWCTNLVAKPLATEFGGGVSVIGMVIALTTYAVQRRQGRTLIFPTVLRADPPVVPPAWRAAARDHGAVLVLLPPGNDALGAVLHALEQAARHRPVVFVYRGQPVVRAPGRMFEVVDPYLEDRPAQAAFTKAEALARRLQLQRRFVYIPSTVGIQGVREVWLAVQPEETVLGPNSADALTGIPVDYIRREGAGPTAVRHYLKRWPVA